MYDDEYDDEYENEDESEKTVVLAAPAVPARWMKSAQPVPAPRFRGLFRLRF